ncbi:MAG: ribbon-helix-helix domain-containing protein [Candidatus Eremiobacteraeota bacterium]|nr:ribbon-helix-helix domain-containing protein [Candidatus Eremiobacteraeota bacterium]
MPKRKFAVTLERQLLEEVDALVAARQYPNRSQAIEAALADALGCPARPRLARESALLDSAEERALAEEGLGAEGIAWPPY